MQTDVGKQALLAARHKEMLSKGYATPRLLVECGLASCIQTIHRLVAKEELSGVRVLRFHYVSIGSVFLYAYRHMSEKDRVKVQAKLAEEGASCL